MIQQNKGNILKFNKYRSFQRHKQAGQDQEPFGLRAPNKRLIPFQLFFESGAGSVSWKLVDPSDSTGATFVAMGSGELIVENKSGGGFWVTWYGNDDLVTIPDCGFWEVWVTVDGVVYYSEVLHLYTDGELLPALTWRIRFGNNNVDKGPVLYQTGYKQYFYPTAFAFDRMVVDRDVEDTVDGNNTITHRFTRTTAKHRLEIADVPDWVAAFFSKAGDLADVVFEDTFSDENFLMVNVTYESRVQDSGLNVGVFTFDGEIEAFNGCQENFELA